MSTEELMQNDWLKLKGTSLYCKVHTYTEDGKVLGKTIGGGFFAKDIDSLDGIELTQDVILCTPFWLVRKGVFKKTVRGVATFTYDMANRHLQVDIADTGHSNVHTIAFMHELQHLYLHYVYNPLEVDFAHSKRKEYSKKYNAKKNNVLRPDE